MTNYATKSPLQNWAWNRFKLKGAVTSSISLLNGLITGEDIAPYERTELIDAITHLKRIAQKERWDKSHKSTRKERE
jgi:hypothetical protein